MDQDQTGAILTGNDALRVIELCKTKINRQIVNNLRTMGLPLSPADDGRRACQREKRDPSALTMSAGATRQQLEGDQNLREDIFVDVQVRFWQAAERGTIPADAEQQDRFLNCIVQRTTWEWGTKQARYLLGRADDIDPDDVTPSSFGSHPGGLLEARETVRRLMGAISELPTEDRDLFVASLEREPRELAKVMGCESIAVRRRLHVIRRELAAKLGLETQGGGGGDESS